MLLEVRKSEWQHSLMNLAETHKTVPIAGVESDHLSENQES